ncbi:MAG: GSU2403 family nucleotidyltransferase fold protein [Bacillota bacterium]|nr:GSU2403 family nucleotidyltransferase fold protein [Bacillota bacterium]
MAEDHYSDFWEFIKLLAKNDLLEHVVVIGSWVEYLYAQAGILPGFDANLRTLDIDFLVKNRDRPVQGKNIAAIARDAGYTVAQDVLEGTTKIYTPGLMEIEFLILQQGAGEQSVLKTNLGVNAQALRHLGLLKEFTMIARIFDMEITVPMPEAYVLHKIIINEERGKKTEKDKAAILTLLPFLNGETWEKIFPRLTKKENKIVTAFLSGYADMRL